MTPAGPERCCARCGTAFVAGHTRARFCSGACRAAAHRAAAGGQVDEAAARVALPAPRCDRHLVFIDSTHWQCACGAKGPSGRRDDGTTFNDETTLAHAPGESRGSHG